MSLQLEVSRQEPIGNLADNISGFMTDTLSVIRHKNARKILSQHCDGVIRRFSEALGKGEQQCSNFLRLKNPVKIGNKIAREIGFAFGYPNKWLDLDEHQDQEDVKYVNSDILSTFIQMEDLLKRIANFSLDGFSFNESLVAKKKLHEIQDKQHKILKHINYDLDENCRKVLHAALHRLNMHPIKHPLAERVGSMYAAITIDNKGINTGFRLSLGEEGVYNSYPQAIIMHHMGDVKEEYECFPILIGGEPALVYLYCPEGFFELEELDDWDAFNLIKTVNEFEKDNIPDVLVPYINQHPRIKL